MPYDFCLSRQQQQQQQHSRCWNGTAIAAYERSIASEEGQINPEVEAQGVEVIIFD